MKSLAEDRLIKNYSNSDYKLHGIRFVEGLFSTSMPESESDGQYDQREVLRLRVVGDMNELFWDSVSKSVRNTLENNPSNEHITIEIVG